MDRSDFPEVLRRLPTVEVHDSEAIDPGEASYFLSRITLRRTKLRGMRTWRKALFVALAHNAASQAEFLHLPDDRTIVMGAHIDL